LSIVTVLLNHTYAAYVYLRGAPSLHSLLSLAECAWADKEAETTAVEEGQHKQAITFNWILSWNFISNSDPQKWRENFPPNLFPSRNLEGNWRYMTNLAWCIVTWCEGTTLAPLPTVAVGSWAGSLEWAVMASVTVIGTLCAAAKRPSESAGMALKYVLSGIYTQSSCLGSPLPTLVNGSKHRVSLPV